MNYINPNQVISPQEYISNIRILHDGGNDSFSLARVEWEGEDCFAIRWNIARREWDDPEKQIDRKQCIGMPSSHGYPIWFILPEELIDQDSEIWRIINEQRSKG